MHLDVHPSDDHYFRLINVRVRGDLRLVLGERSVKDKEAVCNQVD